MDSQLHYLVLLIHNKHFHETHRQHLFVLTDGIVSLNHVPLLILFFFSFHDAIRQPLCYSHEALLELDKKMQIFVKLELLMACPLSNISKNTFQRVRHSQRQLYIQKIILSIRFLF